ncbi:MAG: AAA family ATPase [Holosporales bacterium]|jgi:AAA15 family ATPase/GTPase
MLISFKIKNFKSIGEEQTFSMVAANKESTKEVRFESGNAFAPKLLKVASIFGPNGGGKTTFVQAMDVFRDFVLNSADSRRNATIDWVKPFKLDTELRHQPSEFEAIFVHDGALYQYGFAVTQERVWGEWLFTRANAPRSKLSTVFERYYNESEKDTKDPYEWYFNAALIKEPKGTKEAWKQQTKPNTLFLSKAMSDNAQSESLVKPFEWIQKFLRIIETASRISRRFSARCYLNEDGGENYKQKIQNLLDSTNTGIKDIDIQLKTLTLSDFPEDIIKNASPEVLEAVVNGSVTDVLKITILHQDNAGNSIGMDFNEESDGIKTLFCLAGPWFDVLENGYTLVVDELHNSFHPHALRFLVNLFYDPAINKKNAQLIFTSHETSIMSGDFMHRDQIWFMQRNEQQQSELYSLAEFTNEKGMNNFQKSYLIGRYGALPNLKAL